MTPDIVELIEERKENIRLYKATMEEVYLNEARRLRNLISTRIKAARSEYWLNELEENSRDHKKFWRRVNQILNPKENTLCPNLIHHETGNEVPPKDAPQYINEYFASVGETLANVILNQALPQDNDRKMIENIGIDGKILLWTKGYLRDRLQRTTICNEWSTVNKVMFGVPQGSILGPLFFIIYVNDIVKAIKHSSCKLYADDLVLHIDDVNPAVACVKLQADVHFLSDWCNRNLMTLNEKKTQVCWYGSPQQIATLAPLSITHKGSITKLFGWLT